MGMGLLVVRLYYHKSKKKFCMVQKSSVKKDALLPWSQRGRVGGRVHVFTPSPQSPPPLLQLPGGGRREELVEVEKKGSVTPYSLHR